MFAPGKSFKTSRLIEGRVISSTWVGSGLTRKAKVFATFNLVKYCRTPLNQSPSSLSLKYETRLERSAKSNQRNIFISGAEEKKNV